MAYKLASSTSIDHIHDVFQVLSLLKYTGNLSHMLRIGEIQLLEDLIYKERLVQILDMRVKQFRNQQIPLVKVLQRDCKIEEVTWEIEQTMRDKHPKLFLVNFNVKIPLKMKEL